METGLAPIIKGMTASLAISFLEHGGQTLWVKKYVAIFRRKKSVGIEGHTAPPLRVQPVSSRKRKQQMTIKPSRPTLYQNWTGQGAVSTMKPENVPPEMVPRRMQQLYSAKHFPRSWRKNISMTKFAPTKSIESVNVNYFLALYVR